MHFFVAGEWLIHVIALQNYVVRLGNMEIPSKICFIGAETLVVKSVDDIKNLLNTKIIKFDFFTNYF